MKWIRAEGIKFKYIFPTDDIMKKNLLKNILADGKLIINQSDKSIIISGDRTLMQRDITLYQMLQNGDNSRLIILKTIKFFKARPFYRSIFRKLPFFKKRIAPRTYRDTIALLVWTKNDIDLMKLDQKIINNTFNDEDFRDSIIASVKRIVCSRGCYAEYMSVVFESFEFYLSNSPLYNTKLGTDLFEKKMAAFRGLRCPNCNTHFTILVAKILYKCKDKKFFFKTPN